MRMVLSLQLFLEHFDVTAVLDLLQGTQQGGALAFNGKECFWQHYDDATAAHADPEEVKKVALLK